MDIIAELKTEVNQMSIDTDDDRMDIFSRLSSWSLTKLEASLLPQEGTFCQKTAHYAFQFFQFLLMLPLAIFTSTLSFALSPFLAKKEDKPLTAFAKHPEWNQEMTRAAPVEIGFSTADFQENGPEIHPDTNWGQFYAQNAQKFGPLGQMPDLWNHPEHIIASLNELGCRKFRFSISRDKIEPRQGQPIDQVVLQRYRDFCRQLRENGIEPMVTLHHFSDPTYFSWERAQDIDGFVQYAQTVTEALYEEGVRKIITLNEPTVLFFQGWIAGEFPPHGKLNFQAATQVIQNMMTAHARVYHALKERHPDLEIGLAHNPIRFRHFHKAHPLFSPIERILCHYLTELNHSAFFRFLQTGTFSLKIPFKANCTFTQEKPPLDFIGLQYYTDPLIKLSLTKGESVTRVPDEKCSAYGYRPYPQGLASALEEFSALKIPIEITETGIDVGINKDDGDSERIRHFDRLFQSVQRALNQGIPVRSFYFWTLRDNLEWYKAWDLRFGFFNFNPNTGQSTARPACEWLRERIAAYQTQRAGA